jgi:outer membrane protein, heavy metal efflux system
MPRFIQTFIPPALILLPGCVLAPAGTKGEEAELQKMGASLAFETRREDRTLPEIVGELTWQDALRRAFLANGELEAAYFEWEAALARIPQVANWPNTNVAPTFGYMFSSERMKSFDRASLSVGFDPMENLSFPTKTAQAGKVALEEARAARERFLAKKFELQEKVLKAYLELSLHAEKLRIQRDNVALLKLLADTAGDRVRAGGSQQDFLRAQTQYRLAENELGNIESEHRVMTAALNGLLARDPAATIALPAGPPAPRPLPADDAALIAAAVDRNPELAALARQVSGRREALELARMAYIPDINPAAAFTGGVSQAISAMVVLPTTIPEIKGRIREARAMRDAAEAQLRQARRDRAARFVAALVVLRNSERQAALFRDAILPQAQQVLASARDLYATGGGSFSDLIEAQRTLLDVRFMVAEAQIEREKRLAELEMLAGVDVETIGPTAGPPSRPSVGHHESGDVQ